MAGVTIQVKNVNQKEEEEEDFVYPIFQFSYHFWHPNPVQYDDILSLKRSVCKK